MGVTDSDMRHRLVIKDTNNRQNDVGHARKIMAKLIQLKVLVVTVILLVTYQLSAFRFKRSNTSRCEEMATKTGQMQQQLLQHIARVFCATCVSKPFTNA